MTRSFLLFALLVGLACDPPPTEIPPGSAPTMAPERPIPPPNPPPSRPIEMDADAAPVAPPDDPGSGSGSGSGSEVGAATKAAADGQACKVAADCQSGICEGQGCTDDKPGTCASKRRACTTDLRPYCGCDGTTFRSSSSCPGRRFDARGECKK